VAWRAGDAAALSRLMPLVERELHRIAQRCMAGERGGNTLQATALVNEAYLRLINTQRVDWQNRAHFLAMAARVMRRVLVDSARAKRYQKRGGGGVKVTLDEGALPVQGSSFDVTALDDALSTLAKIDERRSQVIELRFFGGLTVEETAAVLGVSVETVMRDARLAKAWLARELLGPS
jgi:RNA polymerase sigma factor (TIGR02999 family)